MPTTPAPEMVVMVSIDGLRAMTLADPDAPIPTLRGLVRRGARARAMRPVFPSVTWPCHTTLVTGVSPARQGVLGNHVFDRARGEVVSHYGDRTDVPIAVETLWDRVHAAGGRVAGLCWPKTRGVAAVPDNIPEFYEQELFEKYASPEPWRELLARGLPVGATARGARSCEQSDAGLAHARSDAARAPDAAHVDALLGRLLDGFHDAGRLETTTFVVFGDHGFVDVGTTYHANLLLREEGLIGDTRRHAWVAGNGGAGHVYVLDGAPRTTIDRLRERFGALSGIEVLDPTSFAALGLPAPATHSAQGDLMLRAAPGYQLTGYATAEIAAAAPVYRATHGHDPALPELGAALVLAGPRVRDGITLDDVSMLDVAPTAARLLGLDLAAADGRVLIDALA
jgi:predicted AlkP superfamily pyrophosphatase or phosphodiesterase